MRDVDIEGVLFSFMLLVGVVERIEKLPVVCSYLLRKRKKVLSRWR